jgi:hypothetical protein
VLEQAGIDPLGPVPYFKTWASRKRTGSVLVQLYEKGDEK